eukprot:SAG11_NODE_10237_length_845_cov_0.789544_1_plen_146_part_00
MQVGDAFQWLFNASTALFPSTYMHFNQSASPPPLGRAYNSAYVRAITKEAERVVAARGRGRRIKVLPWVWYRYIYKETLLEPADVHTALAGPGAAGADGVLLYEDGLSNPGAHPGWQAERARVQHFVDTVLGPTATALYGRPPLA